MDSRQSMKERAEAAAWEAVEELNEVNKERRQHEFEHDPQYHHKQEPEQTSTGILESILKPVEDTYDYVKESLVSKTQGSTNISAVEEWTTRGVADNVAERGQESKDYTMQKAKDTKVSALGKTGEYKDYAIDTAKETKDSAAEKARQAKDATMEKMGEHKDYAAEKAQEMKVTVEEKASEYKGAAVEEAKVECKDYAAEKATETKDMVVQETDVAADKITELKDTAVAADTRARDFLTGWKEEAERRALESGKMAEVMGILSPCLV